ncbi:MAG: TetR/AcrR family transcriptional regulator [Agriterribacter sp.]
MEIQERIAQKAYDLFLQYGIRSISMDEIAAQLGISKKTIYQFYTDKDALVDSVIDIVIRENEDECSCCQQDSDNPIHEVFVAIDMVQEMLRTMNPTIMYDLQKYHPSAFQKISDHKNKFLYKQIKENVEKGIALQLYRSDINVEIISRYRLATTFMLFSPDLFPLGKHRLDVIMEEISIHFLYGLATPKGVKLIQKYQQQRQNKHI